MKLFDNQVSSVKSANGVSAAEVRADATKSKKTTLSRRSKIKPEKENISENEIREKLASSVQLSNTAKQKTLQNSKKLGEGFLSEEITSRKLNNSKIENPSEENSIKEGTKEESKEETKVAKSDDPNTKDHIIKSDVGINDPADVTTTEKLKTVLSKGAFNFNSKERDVLDKILNDS